MSAPPNPMHGNSTDARPGVEGDGIGSPGVYGKSASSDGVLGEGVVGVYGRDISGTGNGVIGYSQTGRGVWGHGDSGIGVLGDSVHGHGVHGTSQYDVAVWGESQDFEGVHAVTRSMKTAGLAAYQANADSNSPALFAKHEGNRLAGLFEGSILVTGDISLQNADCAEDFDMAADGFIEPGTVMVLNPEGALRESYRPYDTAVVGVLSGAADYKPGLVLDRQPDRPGRQALALLGKTFCKVDARFGPVEVGTMLTTSPTPGFAMRVEKGADAFGAVIGKALRPLREGLGLIPILIALQ